MPELRLPTARAQGTQFAPPSVQEAPTAVKLSESAMMAPGAGLASMGQDIQKVGQQTGAFFEQLKKKQQGAEDKSSEWNYRLGHQEELNNLKINAASQVTAGKMEPDAQYKYINDGISRWEKDNGLKMITNASPEAQNGIVMSNRLKTENDLVSYRVEVEQRKVAEMKASYDLNKDSLVAEGTLSSLDLALEGLEDAVATQIIGDDQRGAEGIKIKTAWARRAHQLAASSDPIGVKETIIRAKEGDKDVPVWAKIMQSNDELLDESLRETDGEIKRQSAEGQGSLTLGIAVKDNPDNYPNEQVKSEGQLQAENDTLFNKGFIDEDTYTRNTKEIFYKPDLDTHLASHVSRFRRITTSATKLKSKEEQQAAIDRYTEEISNKNVKILASTRNDLIADYTAKVTGVKEYSSDDFSHAKSQAYRLVDLEVDRAIGSGDVLTPNPNSAMVRMAGFTQRDGEDGDYYQFNAEGDKVEFDPSKDEHIEMIHRAAEQAQDAIRDKLKNGVEYNKAVNEVLYPETPNDRINTSKSLLGRGVKATPAGIESARNTYMMIGSSPSR